MNVVGLGTLPAELLRGGCLFIFRGELPAYDGGFAEREFPMKLSRLACRVAFTLLATNIVNVCFAATALTQPNPPAASIYEAIDRYSTIEDATKRTAVVAVMIAPMVRQLEANPTLGHPLNNASALELASSDAAFALFLGVASLGATFTPPNAPLTLPCAALVRRPGLMAALGSVYGGAIDSQLVATDCEATLPALPALDALAHAAEQVQPDCPGTVRFSLYREYTRTRLAVRLHDMALWRAASDVPEASMQYPVDEPRFIADHQALMRQAAAELAAYYTSQFAVPAGAAQEQAQRAVHLTVSGAYNLCIMG